MNLQIRTAIQGDAPEIERLYQQSAEYLRSLGDTTDFKFSADVFLRDGFGDNPAFSTIIAVDGLQTVAYLIYQFTYDTDRAIRILYVLDLLVDSTVRGQGIGSQLMDAAYQLAYTDGASEMQWAVYIHNRLAIDFYQKWGARMTQDVLHMYRPIL